MSISDISILALSGLLLAGCQDEARLPGDPPAAQMRLERAACEARGGEYAPGGLFAHACFLPTPDAGKACQRAGDCSGVCLADFANDAADGGPVGGHCSEVTPYFGCFSYLDDAGALVEICVD